MELDKFNEESTRIAEEIREKYAGENPVCLLYAMFKLETLYLKSFEFGPRKGVAETFKCMRLLAYKKMLNPDIVDGIKEHVLICLNAEVSSLREEFKEL